MMIDSGIEKNEAQKEIEIILKHFFNYTEIDKIKGKKLNDTQLKKLENIVQTRISKNFPIQYIIGEAYFMGEYFKVTPEVLIPRDETEILVNKAIEIIKKHKFSSALDIGTGSGCIACTIAKQTSATVLGVDISSDALRIALDNVTKLNINNRAVFRKSDLFSKVRSDEKFDVIVSNPPYIPHNTELEKENSENNLTEIIEDISDINNEYLKFKEDGIIDEIEEEYTINEEFEDLKIENITCDNLSLEEEKELYSLNKEIDNEENLENNFNSEEIIENVENKFEENNNVDEDILNSYNKVLSDNEEKTFDEKSAKEKDYKKDNAEDVFAAFDKMLSSIINKAEEDAKSIIKK